MSAIYWCLLNKNLLVLLAEIEEKREVAQPESWPMKEDICSKWTFDRDEVKIIMKISSLVKLRIVDYEICVCEYGLQCQPLMHAQKWIEPLTLYCLCIVGYTYTEQLDCSDLLSCLKGFSYSQPWKYFISVGLQQPWSPSYVW